MSPVGRNSEGPKITSEREPLADINITESDVRIILELPGVKKRRYQDHR